MAPIRLEGVWKSYPRWPAGGRTLRAAVANRLPRLAHGDRSWVLRDISLEVAPGRAIGVIGRNAAGKSTLLRIACGLTAPDRGALGVSGRVAAVLTLGETFDPSLTGRENAVTAAVVAGRRRGEARALVPDALAFAELAEHADAPVRTYSDGMKLRLAFGVLAQLTPDALVVDEVIAVGDLAFQAKCMDWIAERRAHGTAVLLASHDLRLVERECDHAIWLEDGGIAAAGESATVIAAYEEAARARVLAATPAAEPDDASGLELRRNRVGTQEATIASVELAGPGGPEPGGRNRISPGDALAVRIQLTSPHAVRDPIVAVSLYREHDDALCLEANTRDEGITLGTVSDATVTLSFDRLDLAPGRYLIDFGFYRADWEVVYDFHWHAVVLEVGEHRASPRAAFQPPHSWRLE